MENEQQLNQYKQSPQIIKRCMSVGAAIILGISGIIIASIIAGVIIFTSGAKTIRDINFGNIEGFNMQVSGNQEKLTVDVDKNKNQEEVTFYAYDKVIKYNSKIWKVTEDRYCAPTQGDNGLKYDGTPCDLTGFTFSLIDDNADGLNVISMKGRRPISCDKILNTTKCDSRFALVTSSNKTIVLEFYDYLLGVLSK